MNADLPGDTQAPLLGRYPHAIWAENSPACSWVELARDSVFHWGRLAVARAPGFQTDSVMGVIGPDVDASRFALVPNGNIWKGVARKGEDTVLVVSYDPLNSAFSGIYVSRTLTGVLVPEAVRAGPDGSVVVFGWNVLTSRFAFSVLHPASEDFGPPVDLPQDTAMVAYESLDGLFWGNRVVMVAAVYTDTGYRLPDEVHAYVYDTLMGTVEMARLDKPDTLPHYIHHPQVIASMDGAVIVVLWAQSADTTLDPAVGGFRWDIWFQVSMDGGTAWSSPVNIGDPAVNEVMPQMSGTFSRAGPFFVFATSADTVNYPNWDVFWATREGQSLVPIQYNFVRIPWVPVVEARRSVKRAPRTVLVPSGRSLTLSGPQGVRRAVVHLIDGVGRRVQVFTVRFQEGRGTVSLRSLPAGLYGLRVVLEDGEEVRARVLVVR